MPEATSSTKRSAEVVEAIVVDVVDIPKKLQAGEALRSEVLAMEAELEVNYATSDALVLSLASHSCLGNALMWEYAIGTNITRDVLEAAVFGLQDVSFNTTGEQRKTSVNTMIRTYWGLHSKYVAPNGEEVNFIYTEVLNHFMNIYNRYGDDFLKSNSRVEQDFLLALAREAVAPDEAEKVAENGVSDMLQGYKTKNGMASLVDMWLSRYGNIPSRSDSLRKRVNMNLNEKVYFRFDGVLAVSIRIIREFIQRLGNPELPQDDNKKALRDFLDWQMLYGSNFKLFPSCVLLACECILPVQKVTELQPDFWQHPGAQEVLRDQNSGYADTIAALFIYSGVDPSHGIDALLEYQWELLNGADKERGLAEYDYVLNEHTKMRGPPWRTKNAAWPEAAVMENSNYAHALIILDAALKPIGPIRSAIVPSKEAFLEKEKEKTTTKVTGPPKEEEIPESEQQSSVPWGPLLGLTAGIAALGAVYMSKKR